MAEEVVCLKEPVRRSKLLHRPINQNKSFWSITQGVAKIAMMIYVNNLRKISIKSFI